MAGEPLDPATGRLVIYQDGATRLQVRLEGSTVWLSQRLIAELYQVSVPTVNEHLAGIYTDGELRPEATIRNFRIVQREPHGPVRRADVTVAKNYLAEDEIRELNRVVSMYLDFTEDQARRHTLTHMAQWVERLDAFLQFNERNVLTHAGSVSHQIAEQHAHEECERYDADRRRLEAELPVSDFDRAVEDVKRLEAGAKVRKAPAKTARKKAQPKAAPRRRQSKRDET